MPLILHPLPTKHVTRTQIKPKMEQAAEGNPQELPPGDVQMNEDELNELLSEIYTDGQQPQYDQFEMPPYQQLQPLGRFDSSYFSANHQPQLPQVEISILSQPMPFCRIRSEAEIEDFVNRGSTKSIGSQLKGGTAGKNDFVKISLNLTDASESQTDMVVEGELLVLLVGAEGSLTGQPIQLHPWNLTGQCCNADGIYRQSLTLSVKEQTLIMLNKFGIVQCTKHKVQERHDQKAQMLCSFFSDPNLHSVLHDPRFPLSGPLSAVPLKDAKPKLRLLFAFVPNAQPQTTVLNAYAVSKPITCGAGNSGGKEFKVKAFNPHFVYLKDGSTHPASCDIWVQLEADVKVMSETVTAKLLLPDATDTNCYYQVDIKVEVQRNLLKLDLTSLTAIQLFTNYIRKVQFAAQLQLIKQSNAAGANSGADTFEETVTVVFSYIDSPPQKKPRRAERE